MCVSSCLQKRCQDGIRYRFNGGQTRKCWRASDSDADLTPVGGEGGIRNIFQESVTEAGMVGNHEAKSPDGESISKSHHNGPALVPCRVSLLAESYLRGDQPWHDCGGRSRRAVGRSSTDCALHSWKYKLCIFMASIPGLGNRAHKEWNYFLSIMKSFYFCHR